MYSILLAVRISPVFVLKTNLDFWQICLDLSIFVLNFSWQKQDNFFLSWWIKKVFSYWSHVWNWMRMSWMKKTFWHFDQWLKNGNGKYKPRSTSGIVKRRGSSLEGSGSAELFIWEESIFLECESTSGFTWRCQSTFFSYLVSTTESSFERLRVAFVRNDFA